MSNPQLPLSAILFSCQFDQCLLISRISFILVIEIKPDLSTMFRVVIVFNIMLFASCTSEDYILFKHVGQINKPMPCIVISKEADPPTPCCEWQKEDTVKAEEFSQLEKFVLSNDTRTENAGSANSFGSFRVQLGTGRSYVVEGQQNAIEYFTNLVAQLNQSGDLKLARMIERDILKKLKGI
jgi:hypothetical protein